MRKTSAAAATTKIITPEIKREEGRGIFFGDFFCRYFSDFISRL
jgi:hypothetical protein